MKIIRITLLFMVLGGLFLTSHGKSQAIVDRGGTYFYDGIESTRQLTLTSPNGKMNINVEFYLPSDTEWLPEEGTVETGYYGQWFYFDDMCKWFEGEYTLTSERKLQFNLLHKKKWELT